jgi:signal peptidase II
MDRKKLIILTIISLAINFGLDRITKLIAVNILKGNEPIRLLYNSIVITYTENSGAFLSMGSDWPVVIKYILLLIIPIALCIYGVYYCMVKENQVPRLIFLSTIIGGGLSNLIDRLINDFRVVDFLNFGIGSLRTGILNVADLSVTFGGILFVIYEFRHGKKKEGEKTKSSV